MFKKNSITNKQVLKLLEPFRNPKFRWIALGISASSVIVMSTAIVSIQWVGWTIGIFSCLSWTIIAYLDRDNPRVLLELMYFTLSFYGAYNWLMKVL